MAEVARRRLSEQVAQHLRELIVEGEIGAGEALPPERELSRRFGVSSVVIREALTTLSVSGLVSIRHGVGSFVTTPDHWHVAEPIATLIRSGRASVLDVLEVRSMIEIEAAGLAAHRRDPAALRELDGALARMAGSTHNPVANVEADLEFHRALAAGTGNPVLALVLQPILAPIHTGMLRGTRLPEATERALDEHRDIRNAVADGDADAARAAMRHHMHTARAEATLYARPLADEGPAILDGRAGTPRAATRRAGRGG